jgi:predicted AlkP superfamily phosphohydrolase/phosphomutase
VASAEDDIAARRLASRRTLSETGRLTFRVLKSAALAGALVGGDVVLLTLFLNPHLSLRHEALALAVSLFLPYSVTAALGLWALALLAAAFRGWPASPHPPLPALPWFTSLTVAALGTSAALFWRNLLAYRHSVPLEVLPPLAVSSVALTAAALVLLAVGLDALLFPNRARGLSAALVVMGAASAWIVPLAVRPQPAPRPAPARLATEAVTPIRRVILVGMDGLGPDQLRDGVARGDLTAFAQILRRGAHGPLATLRPTEGPPIWTTIFTGRLPRDHGVKSFVTYRLRGSATAYELLPTGAFVGGLERLGLVTTSPVTAASRRGGALWNALNAFGIQAGVVRFWGTHPPEPIQGFMLSHYFHLFRTDPARAAEALHPRDLAPEVSARSVDPRDLDPRMAGDFVDLSVEVPRDRVPWRRELVERALAPDLTYQRAGSVLRAAYDPPFFATYFYGLDVVGHTFTRYAQPDLFGDVRPEERRRYGAVVPRYEAYLSRSVGELMQGLRPGEVLLVVSGYGMRPLPPWRRAWEAALGEPWQSGTHAGAPDGLLLALGDGIRAGATLRSASVLDVAPTILYLMGLPVARDMEGRVLAEMLDESFIRAHPVTFIPSYESLAVTPLPGGPPSGLPPIPEEEP